MKLIIATLTANIVLASAASALVQPTFVENHSAAQEALSKFSGVTISEVLATSNALEAKTSARLAASYASDSGVEITAQ